MSFKSKDSLNVHKRKHTGTVVKIQCPGCERKFCSRKGLQHHVDTVHKELSESFKSEYVCDVCGQDFVYKVYVNYYHCL